MSTSAEDRAAFLASIPDTHQATFNQLRQLIEDLVPDAEVTLKWGTIAYDLNGSPFSLSTNKTFVNLYILTVGLIAEYADELAGIPQGKCVLRFTPDAADRDGLPLETLRTIMADAVARKRGSVEGGA